MNRNPRRAFLRKAGLLAAALGLSFYKPASSARARPRLPGADAAREHRPDRQVNPAAASSAVTSYQVQTPHQAFLMDLRGGDYASRFEQLVAQGYRPICLQGVSNGSNPPTYSSIWIRDGFMDWYEWHNQSDEAYQEKFNEYVAQGYCPISITGYLNESGETLFGAIWVKSDGVGYGGGHNMEEGDYQAFFDEMASQGLYPRVVDGFLGESGSRYNSIWIDTGSGDWVGGHGMTGMDYEDFFDYYTSLGFRPISVSGYSAGSSAQLAAYMVNDGSEIDFAAYHNSLPSAFITYGIEQARSNGQPVAIDSYDNAGVRNFAGIWIQKERTWTTTGTAPAELAGFETAMQGFMQERGIPGGALAVTKNSRLVMARGYRWHYDTLTSVQPTSLFRVASLSKQITSMAIMRLVQDGKLSLSSKLTSLLNLNPLPGQTTDARMNSITVQMLLQHSAGWDSQASMDPMFEDDWIAFNLDIPLPITQQNIISYMTGVPLDFDPGARVAYSNYGYLLLGRIIEAVSGLPYADYVQQKVLAPLFIKRMKIGRAEFERRDPNEVPYYGVDVGLHFNVCRPGKKLNAMAPYGRWNLDNMDSHGGWLASAVDMTRFCTALDATGRYPVLNESAIAQTFAVPPTGKDGDGSWYGLGWNVRDEGGGLNTWHSGSFDGTFAYMVRRFDGVNYIALFNQCDDPSGLDYFDIDGLLYNAADAVSSWPAGDLFPIYHLPSPGRRYVYLPGIAK